MQWYVLEFIPSLRLSNNVLCAWSTSACPFICGGLACSSLVAAETNIIMDADIQAFESVLSNPLDKDQEGKLLRCGETLHGLSVELFEDPIVLTSLMSI